MVGSDEACTSIALGIGVLELEFHLRQINNLVITHIRLQRYKKHPNKQRYFSPITAAEIRWCSGKLQADLLFLSAFTNFAHVMTTDEQYMARCLQLASNGRFDAPPNPMVGAVIVYKGKIIGEGYHRKCGGPHAEVNAVRSVKDESLLRESTMYVSLEPCAHYGKTPPCADLIVSKRIPRVVIGCRDSFDQVDGKGIRKLREAGVEVCVGVLEKECKDLNRAFFTFHGKRRPYITLKWAQSADGYIDKERTSQADGDAVRFSTNETAMSVHRLRALSDAILVGRRTAHLDNPSLTTRLWPGNDPLRLVIDRDKKLDLGLKIFDGTAKTAVFTDVVRDYGDIDNVEQIPLDFGQNILHQMMDYLYEHKVQRLLVEGGSTLLQSFLDNDLWDEAFVEEAPFRLGSGVKAPVVNSKSVKESIGRFGHKIWHFLHEK
jgi:diaminohydroxyphosphoribosylaminopyrimidine deaminase/5-amino-6-(5-phosphoribosylamino)uracil reductase